MHIVADDREQQAGVIDALRGIPDVVVDIGRLDIGDYLLDSRVLFERKTLDDLAVSVVDGRLFRQACLLASSPYQPVLVMEGSSATKTVKNVSREAIQGALITLSVFLNIPILRSIDSSETARIIRYTGNQLERVADGGIHRPGYRPKGKHKRQLFILQGLPGIGPKRAQCLLDTFGSIQAIVSADEDALSGVPGLGRKTVTAIRDIVRESRVPYGSSSLPWPDI